MTGHSISGFSPDGSQLAFTDGAGADKKLYIAKSDGSRLWHVRWSGAFAGGATWSPDSKIFYFSGYESDPAKWTAWTADIDDLEAKVFLEECGAVEDTSPDGKFLVSTGPRGAGMGIGQISISDRQCCVLIPDIKPAMVHFSSDAKSILYLDASRGETIIYRQPWQAGKVSSSVQVALKIPFASRQDYSGNAYEFSKDLSTIVYTGLAAKRTCICFAGK